MRRSLSEIVGRMTLYLSLPGWWEGTDGDPRKKRAYLDLQLTTLIEDIENYLGAK